MGAKGPEDAFLNIFTIPADMRFILESIDSIGKGANPWKAAVAATCFLILSDLKIMEMNLLIL